MSESEKSQLVRDILSYLVAHPNAQDTLDGIVEWWLLEQRIRTGPRNVEEALNSLVEAGLVLKVSRLHAPDSYTMNREKMKEIADLLQSDTRP